MPKFKVDVKAFMSVTVEAKTSSEARAAANLYAEFGQGCIDAHPDKSVKIIDDDGWCVDGYSEVEKICPSCEENVIELDEQICPECEEEAA